MVGWKREVGKGWVVNDDYVDDIDGVCVCVRVSTVLYKESRNMNESRSGFCILILFLS